MFCNLYQNATVLIIYILIIFVYETIDYLNNDNANFKLFCIDGSPSGPFFDDACIAEMCTLGFPKKYNYVFTSQI